MPAFLLLLACGPELAEQPSSTSSTIPSSTSTSTTSLLPDTLPFTFTRDAVGKPPSAEEIAAFTTAITGFWRDVRYLEWCSWHAHGLHASHDAAMPAYSLWWQDTQAIKTGAQITFSHVGGADNIMIRTPKVLSQAAWLAEVDASAMALAQGYSRGMSALFEGMVWGEDPDVPESIAARAIFTHNHAYTTSDGRQIAVDYDPVKVERYDWNAHTVPNPDNPTYGDIWVRNMRSKDDLPHMYRVAPILMRLAQDSPEPTLQAAAQGALDHLRLFTQDIVAHDWQIRSREDGEAFIPDEDLASLNDYVTVEADSECTARLATALLAERPFDEDCGDGIAEATENLAGLANYYNYAISRYFHLAALELALVSREDTVAQELMIGLARRMDEMLDDTDEREANPEWDADAGSLLLAAAASGLPLTAEEARWVQTVYRDAAAHYTDWAYWDLWDAAVPDGTYDYLPPRQGDDQTHVRPEELAYLIHYCASPWKNPAGVELVDCEIVLDPERWGQ